MSNEFGPSDFVSRNTSEIVFDRKTADFVATSASWFTRGVVTGPEIGSVSYRAACAYHIGAMQEWARLSGALIPDEMTPFLMDVQAAYRAGLTDRYGDQEAAGVEAAQAAYERWNAGA